MHYNLKCGATGHHQQFGGGLDHLGLHLISLGSWHQEIGEEMLFFESESERVREGWMPQW